MHCHVMSSAVVMISMAVGFTTTLYTYAISAYHHWSCGIEPRSWQCVLNTTLCDKVCLWLATGRQFSLVSSTNKTDRHNISEILLKVALNTINHNKDAWSCDAVNVMSFINLIKIRSLIAPPPLFWYIVNQNMTPYGVLLGFYACDLRKGGGKN